MRQYGYLKTFVLSFYSRDLYRDVAKNWSSEVVIYLILLVALCTLISSFGMQKKIALSTLSASNEIIPQLPIMTLKNGELTTAENRVYYVKAEATKKTKPGDPTYVIAIDTTGKYTTPEEADAFMLITKHAALYRQQDGSMSTHEFASTLDWDINPVELQKSWGHLVHWLWVMTFPLLFVAAFLYRITQAAIYALFGKLFSLAGNVSLTYGKIFKLTVITLTPAIIIGEIFDWFSIHFRYQWLVFLAISMIYLIFAINSVKTEKGT